VCTRCWWGKPDGKRPMGRPRRRWEDNIKMDLQEVGRGCGDWMDLAQDRDRWRALVSTVMNLMLYGPSIILQCMCSPTDTQYSYTIEFIHKLVCSTVFRTS
jgi:hypothetical protein